MGKRFPRAGGRVGRTRSETGKDSGIRREHDGESAARRLREEDGIIVFGGGNGCSERGCLFWVLLSVVLSLALTALANLVLVLI